jgi:hypothetical protein
MQHCKILELFCGFYLGNVSLVGDSALLLTGANCGKVSKQNETSYLGLLASSVLPHQFHISLCSTVNIAHIRVLTVLPHQFHISRCSTVNSVHIRVLTVLPRHSRFSRCGLVNSVHISVLTMLPHQFRFSLCTTAHSVHIHIYL